MFDDFCSGVLDMRRRRRRGGLLDAILVMVDHVHDGIESVIVSAVE